jgi:hypothetical protein
MLLKRRQAMQAAQKLERIGRNSRREFRNVFAIHYLVHFLGLLYHRKEVRLRQRTFVEEKK